VVRRALREYLERGARITAKTVIPAGSVKAAIVSAYPDDERKRQDKRAEDLAAKRALVGVTGSGERKRVERLARAAFRAGELE
jgi:hypothetical protein